MNTVRRSATASVLALAAAASVACGARAKLSVIDGTVSRR